MNKLIVILCCVCFSVFADPPKIVYRAVLEEPSVVKQTGGFLARGMDATRPNHPPPDISLFNHAQGSATGLARYDSGYVSTTTSETLAHFWINQNLGGVGYIYHIAPTGNFIDVNGTLRNFSPHPNEAEYAALGMIRWDQIIGWRRVHFGVLESFVQNNDYNANLFSHSLAGDVEPQLAGFPLEHEAWAIEPWRSFTNCSNFRASPSITEECVPNETPQTFGELYFYRVNALLEFTKILELPIYLWDQA